MLNGKILEILSHPADGTAAIVTQGANEPHVVNTWNSFINVTPDGKFLIPVGGMNTTEKNIENNNRVKLTIGSREVQGKTYKGTGFLITGSARFLKEGSEYNIVKEKFSWARAALEITIDTSVQTL